MEVIAISGPSGSGKTSSMVKLNPKSTYYVCADKKAFPAKIPGYKKDTGGSLKVNGNMLWDSNTITIEKKINLINKHIPSCKRVIIDTASAIMDDDEMARMKEKTFDKWTDMAAAIWKMISVTIPNLREDLIIYMFFHEEQIDGEGLEQMIRLKTNGRKLRKLEPEYKMNTIIRSHLNSDDEHNLTGWFQTRRNDDHCKTPRGMFEHYAIPADLDLVDQSIRHFYNLGGLRQDFDPTAYDSVEIDEN
jgi:hypothetical protein